MPLLNRQPASMSWDAGPDKLAGDALAAEAGRVPADRPGQARPELCAGFFATCANPRCDSAWLRLWRRRDRPVFEGGWCCSEACMAARVAAALGREMDGRGCAQEGHRHRIPLGLVLLEQGWITHRDLREALAAQRTAGSGRLGNWMVRREYASEEQVTRALGLQWGCPVLSMESACPEGLTALIPRLFVDAFRVLPLRIAAGRIFYLGFEDRLDPALALAVERMTGLHVESGLVPESAFRPAHARLLEARFPAAELVEAATEAALAAVLGKAVERTRPAESRLVRVHDCLWLRMWLRPEGEPVPGLDSVRDVLGSVNPAGIAARR